MMHLECLGHHPTAARFYIGGVQRNLREWAASVKQAAFESLKRTSKG